MPKSTEISLTARTRQFVAVIDGCEITGKEGLALDAESGVSSIMKTLVQVRADRGTVYVIGNGGSAAIASHVVNDLVNVAKLRAITLHDSSLFSCMANDYGYEHAFSRVLGQMANPGDVLIAISSSGRSMNIRNAAAQMTDNGGVVITLSGFSRDNPLRSLGEINIWLDSNDFGLVEVGHQFVLHNISDRFAADCTN
jgi:D-sedoheptulose 7-phosphate isomerase